MYFKDVTSFINNPQKYLELIQTQIYSYYNITETNFKRLRNVPFNSDLLNYEKEYYNKNCDLIAGVDEAGRGPLAGPVVAAAVIFPKDISYLKLQNINDSKKISETKRIKVFFDILNHAESVGIGITNSAVIDRLNILNATYKAMKEAINNLKVKPDIVFCDGTIIKGYKKRQIKIVKGDSKSVSIAAASIIAKVTRDLIMLIYDKIFDKYYFNKHKGYGTSLHIDSIKKFGPSIIHRFSFAKVNHTEYILSDFFKRVFFQSYITKDSSIFEKITTQNFNNLEKKLLQQLAWYKKTIDLNII